LRIINAIIRVISSEPKEPALSEVEGRVEKSILTDFSTTGHFVALSPPRSFGEAGSVEMT